MEGSWISGEKLKSNFGQVVLVFQGGGALGAYQAGVYEALHEGGDRAGLGDRDSIGAINASIIAGNRPADRLAKLREFWRRMRTRAGARSRFRCLPWIGSSLPNWNTLAAGVAGFFRPNPLAFLGLQVPLTPDGAGYYSTMPLRETLWRSRRLLSHRQIRATADGRGGQGPHERDALFRQSRHGPHGSSRDGVGRLAPAFPPVRIDGDLYWDGGILSNTPVEAIFDDIPRRNSLVFAVHVWNSEGEEPESIWQVMHRQKEIQYSSRAITHIARQKQIHRLRHIIAELAKRLPRRSAKARRSAKWPITAA